LLLSIKLNDYSNYINASEFRETYSNRNRVIFEHSGKFPVKKMTLPEIGATGEFYH
jgi:hypothetical protein